ncbi:hypothetical protein SE17_12855 [Kouleothrix aurantiaca]|jgi:hypothetical protein|uniref:DUF6916 domain-containing protein n=1 Tax=Kouleothrix aurantiaca TaxID=186479 RepID=A0A0P9D4N6_9CHLR|nr:hypothetical protein SE17_12855 [Kouleothrix aurantiaca]
MQNEPGSADFAARVHQTFQIHYGARSGELAQRAVELIDVSELAPAGATGREQFSLIFCDPDASAYLPQHIYPVEHETLGRMEIFLVPIGPGPDGMRYQAIFS